MRNLDFADGKYILWIDEEKCFLDDGEVSNLDPNPEQKNKSDYLRNIGLTVGDVEIIANEITKCLSTARILEYSTLTDMTYDMLTYEDGDEIYKYYEVEHVLDMMIEGKLWW